MVLGLGTLFTGIFGVAAYGIGAFLVTAVSWVLGVVKIFENFPAISASLSNFVGSLFK
jgi:hypothetical protein